VKKEGKIIAAIASSSPKVFIDSVKMNGDLLFHVMTKDCLLTKEDCSHRIIKTKFFVNFIGEFLVRSHIREFSRILTGLDSSLYEKMVCEYRHADFGMIVDNECSVLSFMMHISLVQEIVIEEFSRDDDMIALAPDDPGFDINAYGLSDKENNSTSSEE